MDPAALRISATFEDNLSPNWPNSALSRQKNVFVASSSRNGCTQDPGWITIGTKGSGVWGIMESCVERMCFPFNLHPQLYSKSYSDPHALSPRPGKRLAPHLLIWCVACAIENDDMSCCLGMSDNQVNDRKPLICIL